MEIRTETYRHALRTAGLTVLLMVTVLSQPAYGADPLLVIRIEGKDFEQALRGLRQETEDDFLIHEMIVSRHTVPWEIAEKMARISPKLVVLMDNISIALYKKYQTGLARAAVAVPSVSLMASFTDLSIRGLKNATGIFYEVPAVTSLVNLRTVMPAVRLQRVGVICRDFMESFVRTNRDYCRKEHIDLIPCVLPSGGNLKDELKKGLDTLGKKEKVDALWVLNDSVLINGELLRDVWLPFARGFEKPVIVGAEILVQPGFRFGTFGVIPDHTELGAQAAEFIYDIKGNNWRADVRGVEQPRSVYKILNLEQAQSLFRVRSEDLGNVDKLLK